MRSYKAIDENTKAGKKLKKKLIEKHGWVCAGCGAKRRPGNLKVYRIDDTKPAEGNNLVLLDRECHKSILSICKMLYLNQTDGIELTRDNGVGCGRLNM